MGASSALELFRPGLMSAVMDAEVVVLAEGGAAHFTVVGAWGTILGVADHVFS